MSVRLMSRMRRKAAWSWVALTSPTRMAGVWGSAAVKGWRSAEFALL
ncbi:hypothetical protein M878_20730 [Streptomyces roseochromogenus subsp. oscitans DS 12.976]|uniref:Uncharacterized protein n=1 Tax=Streptomyces roseochromogenus subsp. oscitans DS 12.976 TaxID=1352936 RepID=V6KJQ1_STRRC|nr:hypothetical protein M878_20730 [Streptomyces roseochromogenus subsp. oscitans DS 12.976]